MRIYDLSKELFSASVFPGDPAPEREAVYSISDQCPCNLTRLTMGSHNGTHVDAPLHFCKGGMGIADIPLEKCMGTCKLIQLEGTVGAAEMEAALQDGTKKLLVKGDIAITLEAARKITAYGLDFLGLEDMTVGSAEVHVELLSHGVVILEAAVMADVPEGSYFLACQPLKLAGLDGSPARPILISFEGET